MSPDCQRTRDMMALRLGGELPSEGLRDMDRHLDACPACLRHWQGLSDTLAALREDGSVVASPELRARTRALLAKGAHEQGAREPVAAIAMALGDVARSAGRGDRWEGVAEGESLEGGDALRVGQGGRALLRLRDRSELWINAGTAVRLIQTAGGTAVRLLRGEVLAFLERQRRVFQVVTDHGTVEVLGTVFDTRSAPDRGTRVSVLRGRVRVIQGAQRREIGPRRRVDVGAQRGVGRPRRLSVAEARRLGAWSAPLRSASRASDGNSLDSVRKETAMNTLKRLAGLAALAVLAVLAFVWLQAGPPSVQQALAEARARATGTRRIHLSEPVQLSLVPQPGTQWRETAQYQGQITERDHFNADRVSGAAMRVVSETQAGPGESPGQTSVSHAVREATLEEDRSRIHPAWHEEMERNRAATAAAIAHSSFVETLDSQGHRLEVAPTISFGENHSELAYDPFLLAHLITPAAMPDGPVTEGTTWTCEQRLVFHSDLAVTVTSTLDHFEEMDGERVAVVRSEIACHSENPVELPFPQEPGKPFRATRELLSLTWNQEARHRLRDGRRLLATGHFDFAIVAAVTGSPGPGMDEQTRRSGLEFHFDFVTEAEPTQ